VTSLGDRRRPRGQAGQSLVEVIVSIVLIGGIFLALAGGLTAINRGTATNEKIQAIDAALVAYGEILRTQVAYANCSGSVPDTYQAGAETHIGLAAPGTSNTWYRPPDMVTEVLGVESWNLGSKAFLNRTPPALSACSTPDSGVQRIEYRVTFDGTTRTGEVVKRRPARS
jgi:type II secretory pathway pseudopilin PulG